MNVILQDIFTYTCFYPSSSLVSSSTCILLFTAQPSGPGRGAGGRGSRGRGRGPRGRGRGRGADPADDDAVVVILNTPQKNTRGRKSSKTRPSPKCGGVRRSPRAKRTIPSTPPTSSRGAPPRTPSSASGKRKRPRTVESPDEGDAPLEVVPLDDEEALEEPPLENRLLVARRRRKY